MNWSIRYAIDQQNESTREPVNNTLSEQDKSQLLEMGTDLNSKVHKFTSTKATARPKPNASDEEWANHLMPGGFHNYINPNKDSITSDNHELALQQRAKYSTLLHGTYDPQHGWSNPQQNTAGAKVLSRIAHSQTTDEVYDTQHSDEDNGPLEDRALHFLTNNAPKENVPELHRGISFRGSKDDLLKKFAVGSEFTDQHRSYSADKEYTKSWAIYDPMTSGAPDSVRSGNIPVVFHTPAKTQAVQVSTLPSAVHEHFNHSIAQEYIHSPGKFRVKKHEIDNDGVHHIHIEQTQVGGVRQEMPQEQQKIYDVGRA